MVSSYSIRHSIGIYGILPFYILMKNKILSKRTNKDLHLPDEDGQLTALKSWYFRDEHTVCRAPVQRWLPAASLPSEASLSFSSVGKVGTNCGPANYCMPQFQLHAVCMLAFNETAGIITQLHHSFETLCA